MLTLKFPGSLAGWAAWTALAIAASAVGGAAGYSLHKLEEYGIERFNAGAAYVEKYDSELQASYNARIEELNKNVDVLLVEARHLRDQAVREAAEATEAKKLRDQAVREAAEARKTAEQAVSEAAEAKKLSGQNAKAFENCYAFKSPVGLFSKRKVVARKSSNAAIKFKALK